MSITVFVGDVGEYLVKEAKLKDNDAIRITAKNYNNLNHKTYCLSLGDLDNLEQFSSVLRQADVIYYSPPPDDAWSNKTLKKWTQDYLSIFSTDIDKKIYNFSDKKIQQATKMLCLSDYRKSDNPQVWISGCSISHGDGVLPHQRYGSIFAEKLSMSVSFLTQGGSSIPWAADQILRSDIRKNDIVVWGITSPNRLTFWDEEEQKISGCPINQFKRKKYLKTILKEKYFLSEHVIYDSLNSIESVINFLEKIQSKLIIAVLLPGIEKYIIPRNNLLMLAHIFGRNHDTLFLDIGSDGYHPGPITHNFYYKKILKKYRELYL